VTEFLEANLRKVGAMRPLLIHTMGEVEKRPEAQEFVCQGRHHVHNTIATYVRHLQAKGLADLDVDVDTAAVMLTAAVMGDVMGRPIVPDVYPPRETVARRYATLFLRAIGFRGEPGTERTPEPMDGETAAYGAAVMSPAEPTHPTSSPSS